MKSYKKIVVPLKFNVIINKNNINISKAYSEWILSIKDERINYLRDFLKDYKIELNCSKKSLKKLFEWFQENIEFRNKTEEELKEYKKFKDVKIEQKTFTAETVSIIFDIALFWGECLIKKKKNIQWSINSVEKGEIGYAFPLIAEDEDGGLNPRQLIEVVAYKIMRNKKVKDEFNSLLEIWSELL